MPMEIMDFSLGVQSIITGDFGERKLPEARPLSSNVVNETSLAEIYNLSNLGSLTAGALTPRPGRADLLRPDVFRKNLGSSLKKLKESRNRETRRFVREDLEPLMEDTELFRTFSGILLEG